MRIRTITYGLPLTVARMARSGAQIPERWEPEIRPIAFDFSGLLGVVGLVLLIYHSCQEIND